MPRSTTILVTGGAGYIGSHTCVELLMSGFNVVVVDNLSNSSLASLERVKTLTNKNIPFYQIDVRDADALHAVFKHHSIDSVMHFAGLKAVDESAMQPLTYYANNLEGTISLLQVMQAFHVKRLVFSSSATVYGEPHATPILEDFPLTATNPYGRSKLMIEDVLRDVFHADRAWQIALLRYFNPVGAHESGLLGEDPQGTPSNLMPYLARVATGVYSHLSIFGGDYPTHDGTGIRDYIHVVDLAKGHVKAVQAFEVGSVPNMVTVNLGTGQGYSVLDMVHAFSQASGQIIPYKIVARRAGDVACCFADPTRATYLLGWRAERTLVDMCRDTWNWQRQNPNGYA